MVAIIEQESPAIPTRDLPDSMPSDVATEDAPVAPQKKAKKERKAPPTEHTKATLFVRQLPRDTTDQELETFFGEIGPLKSCFVVRDKPVQNKNAKQQEDSSLSAVVQEGTELARGTTLYAVYSIRLASMCVIARYAFVRYALAEDAVEAVKQLSAKKFRNGRPLLMELAKHRNRQDGSEKKSKHEEDTAADEDAAEKSLVAEVASPAETTPEKPRLSFAVMKTQKARLRTVLVRGLPLGITKKQMYKKARKFGHIQEIQFQLELAPNGEVHAATKQQTEKDAAEEDAENVDEEQTTESMIPGQVRIVYQHPKEAENAVQHLDNHQFKGAQIYACILPNLMEAKANYRVLVRNLPFRVTEKQLLDVFHPHGHILEMALPRKPQSDDSRGFAFLTLASKKEVEGAMEALNAKKLPGLNRAIAIDWALPKNQYRAAVEQEEQQKQHAQEESANTVEEDAMDVDESEEVDEQDQDDIEDVSSDSDMDNIPVTFEDGEETNDSEDDGEAAVDDGSESESEPKEKESDVHKGTTLFLRNLAFETTEEDLREKFSPYGGIKFCKLTMDGVTGRPRGTGFVQFFSKEAADKVLEEASLASSILPSDLPKSTLLMPETTSGFWLHGRQIFVLPAIDRSSAQKLQEQKSERISTDGRNLYLLKEGYIRAGSQAAQDLKPSELAKREESYQERKRKLQKQPHLFVSKTRLSIRNLSKSVDEKQLRALALQCAREWVVEMKQLAAEGRLGRTERLEWERLTKDEPAKTSANITHVKIIRDDSVVDRKVAAQVLEAEAAAEKAGAEATAATTMTTTKPKKLLGQSKGFGFVEFRSHIHALGCLRRMNNNPLLLSGRRPMVEFSVENKVMLNKQEQQRKRQRSHAERQQQEGGTAAKKNAAVVDGEKKKNSSMLQQRGNSKRKRDTHEPFDTKDAKLNGKKSKTESAFATTKGHKKPLQNQEQSVRRPTKDVQPRPAAKKSQKPTHDKKAPGKKKQDAFEDLVSKYKKKLGGSSTAATKNAKRWFE